MYIFYFASGLTSFIMISMAIMLMINSLDCIGPLTIISDAVQGYQKMVKERTKEGGQSTDPKTLKWRKGERGKRKRRQGGTGKKNEVPA